MEWEKRVRRSGGYESIGEELIHLYIIKQTNYYLL